MRKKSDVNPNALHITTQFRVQDGMAYEMAEQGARLTVLMTQTDANAEWRCEAFVERAMAIATLASTRAGALRSTTLAWRTDGPARGLPGFDWDAVATALTRVRAI